MAGWGCYNRCSVKLFLGVVRQTPIVACCSSRRGAVCPVDVTLCKATAPYTNIAGSNAACGAPAALHVLARCGAVWYSYSFDPFFTLRLSPCSVHRTLLVATNHRAIFQTAPLELFYFDAKGRTRPKCIVTLYASCCMPHAVDGGLWLGAMRVPRVPVVAVVVTAALPPISTLRPLPSSGSPVRPLPCCTVLLTTHVRGLLNAVCNRQR